MAASFFCHLLLLPVFLLFESNYLLIHLEAAVSQRAVHTNDYLPIELQCLNSHHCIYMSECDTEWNSLSWEIELMETVVFNLKTDPQTIIQYVYRDDDSLFITQSCQL